MSHRAPDLDLRLSLQHDSGAKKSYLEFLKQWGLPLAEEFNEAQCLFTSRFSFQMEDRVKEILAWSGDLIWRIEDRHGHLLLQHGV